MACGNSCNNNTTSTTTSSCQSNKSRCGNGYVCIVVLYILLAIIIGSVIVY